MAIHLDEKFKMSEIDGDAFKTFARVGKWTQRDDIRGLSGREKT